ncbi:hypothetical protein GCM10027034_20300 [Ramlibacter solisilvae]|uniref:GNAT family N-acetyltransferase n=1 Tax=Ramlibacter tataouinensis TaxID=94132 RepID=UPI0007776415|nr:GNAT family N-acetyltransferase [Ramlibacter tataouinensis]
MVDITLPPALPSDATVIEVAPADAAEIEQLMRHVIHASVSAEADVLAETVANTRANLDWSIANPDKCCHLKCVAGDRIVGVVLVKDFWNLCSLFVEPGYQGRGVGRALVLAAVEKCRGRHERNALWLNAAANAVSFYARLGFLPRQTVQALPPGFQAMQLPL